jgi:hypothetical protein
MSHFVRSFSRRKTFLEALELAESETKAAALAGGTLKQFRRWAEEDENFKKDWDDALEAGTDYLEDVATERAVTKSDALMLHMLKVRRPEKHDRAKQVEVGGTINVEGAKGKLLNKLAQIRAQAALEAQERDAEEKREEEGEAEEIRLLPAPGQEFSAGPAIARGCKRSRKIAGVGRGAASA